MQMSMKNQLKPFGTLWSGHEKPSSDNTQDKRMRLVDFIPENTEHIVEEWETFARTLTPASTDMTPLALRDHIQEILAFIVRDMESAQSGPEQIKKSHGDKEQSSTTSAAETHAALRLAGGFNIDQMVSEYRALRASIIKLWSAENTQINNADIIDLTRFNESIDQILAESVSHYTRKVSYSKDLFIGILGHDLRTPLQAISMSAQLMLKIGSLSKRHEMLTTQISESSTRVAAIVNDLLEVTRARFGSGFPVTRSPMDMGFVARQLIDEMRNAHPTRIIVLETSGDLKGEWDKARIGQVFSNLIGNAIQYGFKDSPITVTLTGAAEEVLVAVHDNGVPIPPEKLGTLFDSLTRAAPDEKEHSTEINLGLGLYITDEIVLSHGGTIDVVSTEEGGTTFTARFPRMVKEPVKSSRAEEFCDA